MNFRSDNTAGAAPEILRAMADANVGATGAYGDDPWSHRLDRAFSDLFEHEVRVFAVSTGTAANAIALASATPPWGTILCHREAHIECDECGAPEFYSGGAKLGLIEGEAAKIDAAGVGDALARYGRGVHSAKPAAISISQSTERGAVYRPDEIARLGEAARAHALAFHVDGSRFANALACLQCAPADLTWRGGVDLLSFGATKNGAVAAEAIIVFNPAFAEAIERRRKRGGHLLCKSRFVAAQLLAYLEDGLWLRLAQRANELAARIGEAARPVLSAPVETNQVFIKPGVGALRALRAAGAQFYDWGPEHSGEARLVVSWSQPEADVDAFCALLKRTL